MSPALQALQDDLSRNPGVLWIEEGRAHWRRPAGPPALSCQDCHGDPTSNISKMADVATRYPVWDERDRRALTLTQRIEQCRSRHQNLLGPALDTDTGVALQAMLIDLSKGKPIAPNEDPRMRSVREQGERLYNQRMGQLDLSCAHCHDQRAGQRLGGSVIPQAHPNGYPLYRLQWQSTGTLHRRLRNCMGGVRAQSWDNGDPAWAALEAYLMQRAKGMLIESPAVRP